MKSLVSSFLALAMLTAVGCQSRAPQRTTAPAVEQPVQLKRLASTSWLVRQVGGEAIGPAEGDWPPLSLEFGADGQSATGHGGVNRFGGRYQQDGGALVFGPLAMTRRTGPEQQLRAEARYTQALTRVVNWRQVGATVWLLNSQGEGLVELARAPVVKR